MVKDRWTKDSNLFDKSGRKGPSFLPKQPTGLVDQLEKSKISAQQNPTTKMTSKSASTGTINAGKSPKMGKDSEKNNSILPPLPTKSSSTPRKSKVSFLPFQQLVHRRRLSVPEESINRLPKSILKKRHSVSVACSPPAPREDHVDLSLLWKLPWERQLYLPPITCNGVLVFLDKDGYLPPMLRRLSNTDTYSYSQEFLQVLDDMKSRPTS